MISYAQNFEDVILARAFRGKTDGFYVDIGAMDPELHSVTKYFYDQGWHGINIEPSPRFHEKLSQDRVRDINLCVAVGVSVGERTFYDSELHGISTLSADLAEHFEKLRFAFKPRRVDVLSLREICQRHCRGLIDFMKVDVEGAEREVLESGDWSNFRPRIVLVEAITPDTFTPAWANWEHVLVGNGYQFAYFDGLNRFYLRNEDEALRVHFQLPPNVLDGFQTNEVIRLRRLQVPATPLESPTSSRTSVWILNEVSDNVQWRKVGDLSFLPGRLLSVLRRCFAAARRSTRGVRRLLRKGP